MKTIVLLPGNGSHNREWIESIQKEIGGAVQYYDHWISGDPMIDIDHEAKKLVATAGGEPILVFAKSAGCLVALKAAQELGLKIEKAVFVGTAVHWAAARGIPVREWLKDWQVPTLFVHKENDMVISAQELRELVGDHYEILVLSGNDHDYLELDQYIPHVKQCLYHHEACITLFRCFMWG